MRPPARLLNRDRGMVVAEDLAIARRPWSRMVGLLFRRSLSQGQGLLLTPCSSIHTLFMLFPIDVLFFDKEWKVVKTVADLRPFRLALGGRGARACAELPAGTIARSGTKAGDQLLVEGP